MLPVFFPALLHCPSAQPQHISVLGEEVTQICVSIVCSARLPTVQFNFKISDLIILSQLHNNSFPMMKRHNYVEGSNNNIIFIYLSYTDPLSNVLYNYVYA